MPSPPAAERKRLKLPCIRLPFGWEKNLWRIQSSGRARTANRGSPGTSPGFSRCRARRVVGTLAARWRADKPGAQEPRPEIMFADSDPPSRAYSGLLGIPILPGCPHRIWEHYEPGRYGMGG